MTSSSKTARLEKRETALEAELKKRSELTTTERQILAATGHMPVRLEDDYDDRSATARQVARVTKGSSR